MAVGCLITFSPSGTVIARQPYWPWPAPGEYPQYLPTGLILQFFPVSYLRFTLGDTISPFVPLPYFSKESPMRTIAKHVPVTMSGRKYLADVLLGVYASSLRPAIILASSRPDDLPDDRVWSAEPLAVASVNPPPGQKLPSAYSFPAKTWTENEDLWEHLSSLLVDGKPFFQKENITLRFGFCEAPVYSIAPDFRHLFDLVRDSLEETSNG